MKPSSVKANIAARHKAGVARSFLIEGSPGTGKTEIAAQIAAELGIQYKVIHAPLLQPEDYGFPVVTADKKNVEFVVSHEKFPLEGSDCAEEGVLLIDELPQADNSAQKILANILQAREIHGKKIKKGWSIVATGNRVTDRSGANRILGHLSDRVTRVAMETSIEDWTQWALKNSVKFEVIAFLRFRPALLSAYDAQQEKNPTPRGWVQGVSASMGITAPEDEFEIFKGEVGEGAAAEFIGFLKIFRKLPSPDAIMLNPTGTPVPTDAQTQYALCGALAGRATPDNFGRVMSYVSRMSSEFGLLFVKEAIRRTPEIQNGADFIKWAAGPGSKLLT